VRTHRDEQVTAPVVLVKWYDWTKWLLDRVDSFPKNQRFIFGQRLADRSLRVLEILVEAAYGTRAVPAQLVMVTISAREWPPIVAMAGAGWWPIAASIVYLPGGDPSWREFNADAPGLLNSNLEKGSLRVFRGPEHTEYEPCVVGEVRPHEESRVLIIAERKRGRGSFSKKTPVPFLCALFVRSELRRPELTWMSTTGVSGSAPTKVSRDCLSC
jgi:hypothetical protein